MADHNKTKYDWRNGGGIQQTQCMMDIRNRVAKVDIYIPQIWLHSGISDEDVLMWNKIGNETLFPATLDKVTIDINSDYSDVRLKQFVGLRITCKNNYKYKQSDAKMNKFGVINKLTGSLSEIKTECSVYHTDSFSGIKKYSNWHGHAVDHQVYETGECLFDYINRIIKDQEKYKDTDSFNAYKITIDCSNALSPKHRLAILTFYRFLWSVHFDDIVSDTLKIVKSDSTIDPWDALYYAMSKKEYSSYYGLICKPGYVSIEDVKSRLLRGDDINLSFSNNKRCGSTSMSASDFKIKVNEFVEHSNRPFEVECITDKLKTLTKGRKYQAEYSGMYDNSYLVKTDNYCMRHLLKKHFKVA